MDNLIKSRRFLPLLITQFLGALNDNLFKNALLTLVMLKMTAQSDVLSNVIAGLFILPFFIFSAWAGELADKFARDKIARLLKIAEIFLMCGAAIAYYLNSVVFLVVLIALMGAQSAFFGPVKYALLPQQLKPEELITGNAYIEATTYTAILAGLILGTLLPAEISIFVLISLSVCGYFSARFILPAPAPRPDSALNRNLFGSIYANYRFLKKHRPIFQSILGASWFWIIGAFAAVQIYPLCGKILSAGNGTATLFLVLFSLGVAVGSYFCNKLLRGTINMVYVPLSAIGMSVCLLGLWALSRSYPTPDHLLSFREFLAAPHAFGFIFCLFMLAFFGGLYVIPLNAFMQNRAPKAYTATVIAGNNIFNALGMAGVSVLAVILLKLGFSLPQLFLIMGLISLIVAVYICALLPDNLTRSLLQTILRFMFRTKVSGLSHFYKAGKKVLIIANHTSLWDGVLLAAFMPERITFAITSAWTGKWFMPVIRLLVDFYPVDPANPLSVRKLIEHIKSGKKVMIFPEGRITLTGKIMQVYDGAAMIAAKSGAKILPVRIDGAQFSTMSYVRDKFRCRVFPQINLTILEAQKFDPELLKNGRGHAQRFLYSMMTEMMFKTAPVRTSFYEALVESIKLHGGKRIVARSLNGSSISAKKLLRQSRLLAESLRELLKEKSAVALLVADPILFLTALTALDYLNKKIILPAADNIGDPADFILDEQTLSHLTRRFPPRFHRPQKLNGKTEVVFYKNGRKIEHTMSEILGNCAKLDVVLPFNTKDRAVNAAPLSDPDNFVLGVVLPVLSGVDTLFYAGKHTKLIPHLCYDFAATVLTAPQSIFETIFEEASPFDFFSLRMAFGIGGKIEDNLLERFLKQFNVRILENETPADSVLIKAINTPLYNKFGTLGQLLPLEKINKESCDDDGFVLAVRK